MTIQNQPFNKNIFLACSFSIHTECSLSIFPANVLCWTQASQKCPHQAVLRVSHLDTRRTGPVEGGFPQTPSHWSTMRVPTLSESKLVNKTLFRSQLQLLLTEYLEIESVNLAAQRSVGSTVTDTTELRLADYFARKRPQRRRAKLFKLSGKLINIVQH